MHILSVSQKLATQWLNAPLTAAVFLSRFTRRYVVFPGYELA
jgi:hypothetical protein